VISTGAGELFHLNARDESVPADLVARVRRSLQDLPPRLTPLDFELEVSTGYWQKLVANETEPAKIGEDLDGAPVWHGLRVRFNADLPGDHARLVMEVGL